MRSWIRRNIGTVLVGAAVATTAAGGIIATRPFSPNASPTPTPTATATATATPPAGTANLFIDTNGGNCTRSSTPTTYVDAAACGSIQAAFDAASGGDLVLVRGGTYPSQQLSGADKGTRVTIKAAAGETVTATSLGIGAVTDVEVDDFNVTAGWSYIRSTNVISRNIHSRTHDTNNTGLYGECSSNIQIFDSEIGPVDSKDGAQFFPGAGCHNANWTIDGLYEHDLTDVLDPAEHQDALQIADMQTMMLNRVRVVRGPQRDFYPGIFAPGIVSNITLQNSVISQPVEDWYECYIENTATNVVVKNTTFIGGTTPAGGTGPCHVQDSNPQPAKFIGNVFANYAGNDFQCGADMAQAGTVKYNVYDTAGCTSDSTNIVSTGIRAKLTTPDPVSGEPNVHLLAGAAAIDMPGFTAATGCAATDLDGANRPFNTLCDAGADEFGTP